MIINSTRGVNFSSGMPEIMGAKNHTSLSMKTNHHLHMNPSGLALETKGASLASNGQSFSSLLGNAISGIEKLDSNSKKLSAQAVYDPNSVEVHEVLLAAEKARFALNFAKTLSDGLVRTFKELSSPR